MFCMGDDDESEINWHKISNKKIPNCLIGIYPSENDVIKVIALIDRMGE